MSSSARGRLLGLDCNAFRSSLRNQACLISERLALGRIQYPFSAAAQNKMKIKVREWVLDAAIRSASVDGGPAGGESLLLGLENGVVLQVFVDNAFPVVLVKASTAAVVCCAMSVHRKKVSRFVDAVVHAPWSKEL